MILYLCTVDASVYFRTDCFAHVVKVFSCVLSSLDSTTLLPLPSQDPACYLHVYIFCDIPLANGHLGSRGSISKHEVIYTKLSVLMAYIIFSCKFLAHAQCQILKRLEFQGISIHDISAFMPFKNTNAFIYNLIATVQQYSV